MYLLAPLTLQNLKKILRVDPELWGCAIFRSKMAHLSWTNFFWYKALSSFIYFHLRIGPFYCAKFRKVVTADPELWGCTIFGSNHHSSFGKSFISFSSTCYPFHCAKFKKNSSVDPVMRMPKMAHFPKLERFSENLLMILVYFIHAHLHAKNQSQILIY